MAKQINTNELIKGLILDDKSTTETLREIKNNRFHIQNEVSEHKNEIIINNSDKIEDSHKTTLTKSEMKVWDELSNILSSEFYRDKKEAFLMSLSGVCLSQFEQMANGITYKTGKKVTRNEIIRKILEDYINTKKDRLEQIITKL